MRVSAFAACCVLLSTTSAFANELSNGRITVDFDSAGTVTQTTDRVDSVTWVDSSGATSGNYVSNSTSVITCDDPQEFFGEAFGDVDGGPLKLIVPGASAKWKSRVGTAGTSKTTGQDTCSTLVGKTTTTYTLSAKTAQNSEMKIKRTFAFGKGDAGLTENLRAYVPRVAMSKYTKVIYPNAAGVLQTVAVGDCPFGQVQGCEVSDWNGVWAADDDGAGNGILLIRDASSTATAEIDIDYDSFSQSNATSILLMKPGAGWKGKLVETEWLCFYDAASWPAKARSSGKLPKGCTQK